MSLGELKIGASEFVVCVAFEGKYMWSTDLFLLSSSSLAVQITFDYILKTSDDPKPIIGENCCLSFSDR